ncbi:hypothetical protein JSE7799_03577 [Jannaschia seosinensis]|uniref:Green-light absorbing proteorhodopsin n=1 Tax=Jannaschia seosinensis TaxID=313367 RepID=A0A0M7BDG0_9RHOB|nr:bacteriorhodopsin [Jannaschia seosinensis]CUH40837.1 hypothetical protein JSE7799_03577 [Jannaschia seosinensis]
MPNYENFFAFEYWQYEVVRHMFAFTAAVFAAAFVYFALTMRQVAERYRLASIISCVVMISATLELFLLWLMWNRAFEFDITTMTYARAEGFIFANGYRYANWMIDVPMLMTQLLVVLGFAGRDMLSRWWKLMALGVFMILTAYIGQYYEPQAAGIIDESAFGFWFWGIVSWIAFLVLLWLLYKNVEEGRARMGGEASKLMGAAWTLMWITWTIYGLVYLVPGIPGINESSTWIVIRQGGYTFADVTSKAVFGVILSYTAMTLSKEPERNTTRKAA